MSDIRIRTATLNDLPILLNFEQSIVKAERPFDVTLAADPISYYDIETLLSDTNSKVVVATDGEKIVGSGFGVIKNASNYLEHDTYANFHFMYVDLDYRGKGINALIIDDLKKWANAQGIFEIRLTVYNDNIAAIKAYEKVGFKKHIIEMRLEQSSTNTHHLN
ncbi:GNAT family N-acetyltransferase [Cellulophaga sp. HaHaR_3_176]|uniref:GNAT family N-acetyltransferase n=1 Tax=Cellulophaga sp. HaHaR_3_176 TaxID=1942464 RepID=UPI001C1FF0F6|nr:GNAT family N-acetyltransferase [Cellulophaga sp. HaHaR_3_176]QWX84303.1 GNAT family N-acetyltransferase [Cellulophaga sp. HaHaR_3_176]